MPTPSRAELLEALLVEAKEWRKEHDAIHLWRRADRWWLEQAEANLRAAVAAFDPPRPPRRNLFTEIKEATPWVALTTTTTMA